MTALYFSPSPVPLTPEQLVIRDRLYAEYCSKPKNKSRMSKRLAALLRAAAGKVARHGPQQRLAYRMHKRRRARALAAQMYGDPLK